MIEMKSVSEVSEITDKEREQMKIFISHSRKGREAEDIQKERELWRRGGNCRNFFERNFREGRRGKSCMGIRLVDTAAFNC